ncbi:MAG: hypothetical protein P1U42_07015 [Phycisphaerales bacterium]|nr:hypothetical protein [Phycisphaerales bacterium]
MTENNGDEFNLETGYRECPSNDEELYEWMLDHLSIRVVREPLIDGHSAPFSYLSHAFFEHKKPRDCIVWANRGGGKTFYAAVATMLDLIFKPGIEIRILGGSLEQSKRMHAHLRDLFSTNPFDQLIEGKVTDRRIRLRNGSSVELLAQSQTSVRGTRVQKLRCDEVELFDRDVWEAAQLVTREKQCGDHRVRGAIECLSTMHVPYGIMHDLVAESIEDEQESRVLYRWGVVDVLGECDDQTHQCIHEDGPCPLAAECAGRVKGRDRRGETPGHITIDDAISLKKRVGHNTWNAEMLCNRPQRSDCVIPEFEPSIHVVDQLPLDSLTWRWIGGMDFGIRSPTVVLFACVDPTGCIWVCQEYLKTDAPLTQHIAEIQSFAHKLDWIGVDPAGRQRGFQTGISDVAAMRRSGLIVHDRKLGLHEGLGLLRSRFKTAENGTKLYIHRSCEKLIESLEKYHYPKDQPLSPSPEKDGWDHCVDALRYMIQNHDMGYKTVRETYIPNS